MGQPGIDDRMWIWQRYGTTFRSLYSLFELTFSGSWPSQTRPVIEKVHAGLVIFFVIYITTVAFGIIRVITASGWWFQILIIFVPAQDYDSQKGNYSSRFYKQLCRLCFSEIRWTLLQMMPKNRRFSMCFFVVKPMFRHDGQTVSDPRWISFMDERMILVIFLIIFKIYI